jgi:hypothetical protein
MKVLIIWLLFPLCRTDTTIGHKRHCSFEHRTKVRDCTQNRNRHDCEASRMGSTLDVFQTCWDWGHSCQPARRILAAGLDGNMTRQRLAWQIRSRLQQCPQDAPVRTLEAKFAQEECSSSMELCVRRRYTRPAPVQPTWGKYGYHGKHFSKWLDDFELRHPMTPPVAKTKGWEEPYKGLTAALAPDGTVLQGAEADEALSALHLSRPVAYGLVMMSSHHQKDLQYKQSAAMLRWSASALAHVSQRPGGRGLGLAALLLVHNNAAWSEKELIRMLQYYELEGPHQMLRMLVRPTVNMGYLCGELSILTHVLLSHVLLSHLLS